MVLTEWAMPCTRSIVPAVSSAKLCTSHGPSAFMQRGSGIVSDGGPCQTDRSRMPASSAAASVKTLNALPACRRDWVASPKRRWLTPGARVASARTSPLRGSIATSAAAGWPGVVIQLPIARWAARCRRKSSVVVTRSAPWRTRPLPTRRSSSERAAAKNGADRMPW